MWYRDREVVQQLPLRYRAYARYCRIAGSKNSRRVRGGSFLLRALRRINHTLALDPIVRIHGIDGLEVFADMNDERILDVFHEIRGENAEYRVMREILSPGDTFIDAGANFGTFSLLASRVVGESGRVIAIEPQARLVELMRKSIAESKAGNVQTIQAACGSSEGVIDLLVPADDSGRAGIYAGFSGRGRHDRVSVPAITLDGLLNSLPQGRRVMLKIDVEGSEFDVLEGGRRFIEAFRPPIFIELNPWSAAAAGRTAADLLELLQSFGYHSFAELHPRRRNLPAGEIDLATQRNVVAIG
jgi:FkbM family methyltransferase